MTAKGASPSRRSQDRLALESLLQVSRSLVESRDVATIARRTVDSLCGLLAAHHVALFRLDPESEDLIPVAVSGGGEGVHRGLSILPKGMGLAAIALRERGPVVTTDMFADPRVVLPADWRTRIEKTPIRAGLTVPLFVGDRAIGALAAVDRPGRTFTEEDVRLAQAFADLAGAALENARLLAAEHAAREAAEGSERRYRELVQGLDAVVWEADLADEATAGPRRFTFVSEQAQVLLGYPLGRWIEEPGFWAGLIHSDDRERVVAACRDSTEDLQIDYRVIAADGRIVWLRDVVRLFRDREGSRQRRRGVMIDITEVRDAEVARQVADERLAGLLAMAPEGVIAIDERQRILLFSQGAEAIFGYRAEEVMGQPLDLLLPDGFREGHRAHVAAFGASPETSRPMGHRRAILGRRKNGEEFPAEASISKSVRHGETTYSVILRDITERRRAEDALREANQALSAVIDASPAAIWMLDHEGRILLWNPAAEQMFGWSPAEVLGRPAPIVPEDKQEEFRELLARSLQGRLNQIEVRRRRKDGSPIDISFSTSPLRDAAGTVVGNVTVGVDITERKRLEEDSRQSQKMDAIGRLAGGIAHDFNNLLTVITGRAELVLARLADDDPARRSVELIATTAGRAAALTKQLLAFSRKQVLRRRLVDCNALVMDMVAMLSRLIGADVEVVTTLDPRLWGTDADPSQVEQVLLNLAINARDAMPEGGRLRIETANVEIGETFARQHPGLTVGPHIMLAVSDTGIGMDAETRARIFEPFFTTKEPDKGTGLGLSTVYGIVQQHGGGIAAESEPGRGTTFRVYFPRAGAAAGSGEAPATKPGAARGVETVLLVEDEDQVRLLAREILEARGYTVLEAAGPAAALRISQEHVGPIHLLLTDLVMPDMSGSALAERLTAGRPAMKVIYMSGTTEDAAIRQRLGEAGVELVQKPFSPDALALAVRRALDLRRT